jgi:hypothetical protein
MEDPAACTSTGRWKMEDPAACTSTGTRQKIPRLVPDPVDLLSMTSSPSLLDFFNQVQTSIVRVDGDRPRRTMFQDSRVVIHPPDIEQSLHILRIFAARWSSRCTFLQLDIPISDLRGTKVQIRRVEDVADLSFASHCIWIHPLENAEVVAMTHVEASAIILAVPSAVELERWCDCFCIAGGKMYSLDAKVSLRATCASAFLRFVHRVYGKGREFFCVRAKDDTLCTGPTPGTLSVIM